MSATDPIREAAKRIIGNHACGSDCPFCKEMERVESILREVLGEQGWIPVSERLPDVGKDVWIAKADTGEVREGRYYGNPPKNPWSYWSDRCGLFKDDSPISHWREKELVFLPAPPAKETSE